MKILEEDKSYYEGFVIETKKENKALKSELLFVYNNKFSEAKQNKFAVSNQYQNIQEEQGDEGQKLPSFFPT